MAPTAGDHARNLAARTRAGIGARIAPALLTALAALVRPASGIRRLLRRKPRVLFGPTPVIVIKFWSQALEQRGYRTRTFVHSVYSINRREDFDYLREEFLPASRWDRVRDYWIFAWTLLKTDVYVSFYDGGYLAATPLRDRELRLLHLAGKRLVLIPYGSDIAVAEHLGPYLPGYEEHYPETLARSEEIRERVDWFSEGADVAVQTFQIGYQPHRDLVCLNSLAIDTAAWDDSEPLGGGDGREGPVTIVHAPNHRVLKGTEKLIAAVEELRAEGLDVRLDLFEARPADEVRDAVKRADIVADQLLAGYGLFAVEAMSAGRPVLTAIGWIDPELRAELDRTGVPVVDTDERPLAETLRTLVTDPELRRRIGAESRAYALARHSLDAVGANWAMIVDHAWLGTPLGPPLIVVQRAAEAALSPARHSTTERSPSS